MDNKMNAEGIIAFISYAAGVLALTGIALWRNWEAYKAELKALSAEGERDAYKILSEMRQNKIERLEKERGALIGSSFILA